MTKTSELPKREEKRKKLLNDLEEYIKSSLLSVKPSLADDPNFPLSFIRHIADGIIDGIKSDIFDVTPVYGGNDAIRRVVEVTSDLGLGGASLIEAAGILADKLPNAVSDLASWHPDFNYRSGRIE